MSLVKYDQVLNILRGMERVVVAFSGGVDSTLLLKASLDALGTDNVLAVTADSETYPTREMEEASTIARELGAHHRIIQTSELNIPGYQENTPNRCYFCKQSLFQHLQQFLHNEGYTNIVYGLIADDMGEHRPGYKAAMEQGVRGPLQEAGLYKDEIRELSRQFGLPTWDKPSFACLSSRIAYGEWITQEKLTRVDRAERYIMSLGIRQVRVRTHDKVARIEVEADDMATLLTHRDDVMSALTSYGYTFVTMDLGGYKSGNLNKMLNVSDSKVSNGAKGSEGSKASKDYEGSKFYTGSEDSKDYTGSKSSKDDNGTVGSKGADGSDDLILHNRLNPQKETARS